MPTKVIHIKDAPTDWLDKPDEFVYIGRKGKGLFSQWGNPYRLKNSSDEKERALVLKAYGSYFRLMLDTRPYFAEDVKALAGKTLVCFCKPLACHGDVIVEYLNDGS